MYLWTPLANVRSRLPKVKFRQQIPRFGKIVLGSDNLHKHLLSDVGDENRTVTGDSGDERKHCRAQSASPIRWPHGDSSCIGMREKSKMYEPPIPDS